MAMRKLILASLALFSAVHVPAFAETTAPTEADAVFTDYVFSTGERLPLLHIRAVHILDCCRQLCLHRPARA